jgi:cytochrome c oxidase accessory protein FixG
MTASPLIQWHPPREKIYKREISGRYTRWRWACIWLTQAVYYGLPWLSWNGRPAVLFDLAARKFHLFGLVLWPQDFIYLAGLLVLCACLLFLLSAIAGRVWCGFGCPHTVYTEIFMWMERRIEGNRSARIRLDRQPPSFSKYARKGAKHLAWIALAFWTGVTLVGYFTPIRMLLREFAAFSLGPWESVWILLYGGLAYLNAGWMREQFCKYLCAHARIQSVMFDGDTLVISYDSGRGEPRGVRRTWRRGAGPLLGDCIDCGLCRQVCPTGIDIRDGFQFECIDCAACIDACDGVMDKIGAARGLVRYTSENALKNGFSVPQMRRRLLRPRVLAYAAILTAGTAVYVGALAVRPPLKLNVMRDRGTLLIEAGEGAIDNVYRLQVMNAGERPHRFRVTVSGMASPALVGATEFDVDAAGTRVVPVRVRVAEGMGRKGANEIGFEIAAADDDALRAGSRAVFFMPAETGIATGLTSAEAGVMAPKDGNPAR